MRFWTVGFLYFRSGSAATFLEPPCLDVGICSFVGKLLKSYRTHQNPSFQSADQNSTLRLQE